MWARLYVFGQSRDKQHKVTPSGRVLPRHRQDDSEETEKAGVKMLLAMVWAEAN